MILHLKSIKNSVDYVVYLIQFTINNKYCIKIVKNCLRNILTMTILFAILILASDALAKMQNLI